MFPPLNLSAAIFAEELDFINIEQWCLLSTLVLQESELGERSLKTRTGASAFNGIYFCFASPHLEGKVIEKEHGGKLRLALPSRPYDLDLRDSLGLFKL